MKTRFFRFRLRSLLAVWVIFTIWFAWRLNEARYQQDAVEALSAVKKAYSPASFHYNYEFDRRGDPRANPDPPGPNFIYNGLGQHFFSRVVDVSLDGTQATDSDLRHLEKLPALKRLDLEYTSVGDSGLRYIADRFPKLSRLDIQSTNVSSVGLQSLASMTHLQTLLLVELDLTFTKITDEGRRKIQSSLPNCRFVSNWE